MTAERRYNDEFAAKIGTLVQDPLSLKLGSVLAIADPENTDHVRLHYVESLCDGKGPKEFGLPCVFITKCYVGLAINRDGKVNRYWIESPYILATNRTCWPNYTFPRFGQSEMQPEATPAYVVESDSLWQKLGHLTTMYANPNLSLIYQTDAVKNGGTPYQLMDYVESIQEELAKLRALCDRIDQKSGNRLVKR